MSYENYFVNNRFEYNLKFTDNFEIGIMLSYDVDRLQLF